MKEPERAAGRLASIDLLRGVAVLMVVVFHGLGPLADLGGRALETPWDWLRVGLGRVILQGHNGVGLFLLISGFCIHLSFASRMRRGEPRPFLTFWKRRFVRIHPTFLVSIVFTLILVGLVGALSRPGSDLLAHLAYPSWGLLLRDLGLHLAMLHTLVPTTGNLHNAPYWSLALEEHLYLLYFFFLAMRQRWGLRRSVLVVLGFSLSWHLLTALRDLELVTWSPLMLALRLQAWGRWFEWVLGVVLAEQVLGHIALPAWTRRLRGFVLLAVLATLLSLRWPASAGILLRSSILVWGLAFFFLFGQLVARDEAVGRGPGRLAEALRRVGLFSFSLYLVHLPVLRGVLALAQHAGLGGPGTAGYYAMMIAPVAVSLVVAWLFYLACERYFSRWSGRIGAAARGATGPPPGR